MYGNVNGIMIHFIIIYIAEHLGIFLSYYLGKHVLPIGDILAKRFEYFDVFNSLVSTQGIKITFLSRVCLVIPYAVINYIMPTTDIALWDYFIGNHGFILDFFVATYIGVSVDNITSIDSKSDGLIRQVFPMAVGIILVLGIILYVVKLAQREFERMVKK